ncbi:MAG: hypothetical protein QW767_00535 [Thermoprotei archaeon]
MAESHTVIDGTRKECRGVLAMLEQVAKAGSPVNVEAVVANFVDRREVEEWAVRKGHLVKGVRSRGSSYVIEVLVNPQHGSIGVT